MYGQIHAITSWLWSWSSNSTPGDIETEAICNEINETHSKDASISGEVGFNHIENRFSYGDIQLFSDIFVRSDGKDF
jgi:hypothetical protein